MGNTSSIEVPRRPVQKLSKPRTGSHAAVSLRIPNSQSSSTVRFSTPCPSGILPMYPLSPAPSASTAPPPSEGVSESEQVVDRRASTSSVQKDVRRRSLFRSKSSQGPPEGRYKRRSSTSGGTLVRTENGIKSTNALTFESAISSSYGGQLTENRPAAGYRTSWAYDMTSYEAKRLLITEELVFEQSTITSEKMTVVSETTWKNSNPVQDLPQQPASTPISRANSNLSLYTPVRRRSLIQTPGVATRTRSSPAPPLPRFRYSHPPTPSLSRQHSFDSETDRVLYMSPRRITDPDSIPRVVTPCEADYQSIGAFKLGSLRITNGTASPVSPEADRTRRKGTQTPSDDGDGRGDYFSPAELPERLERALSSEVDWSGESLPEVTPFSNETLETPCSSVSQEDGRPKDSCPDVALDTLSLRVSELPLEYLPEIRLSPFSMEDSLPISPKLQTTSKHTAVEDQLFDDEGSTEYSSSEVLDVRLDPNAKSEPGTRPDPARKSTQSVARTDSGVVASPASEYSHKALTKADSGYSSNVSLRSFQGTKAMLSKEATPASSEKPWQRDSTRRQSDNNTNLQLPITDTIATNDEFSKSPDYPPPPVPPKDFSTVSTSNTRIDVFASNDGSPNDHGQFHRSSVSSITRKPVHTPSPIVVGRQIDRGPKSPESIPQSPLSAKSETSTSALSIGSGSHRPSKLQRLLSGTTRRLSNGPPAVHAIHEFDSALIPSVPQEVQAKLHEHTGMFPMTTKRLALKTQASKDTLKTIFSVGSLEVSKDDLLPPLPPLPPDAGDDVAQADKGVPKGHSVPTGPSLMAHATAFLIPRKPIARKPVPTPARKEPEKTEEKAKDVDTDEVLPKEAELTTYQSLSNTLGRNAYDAAWLAMPDERGSDASPKGRAMSMTIQLERSLQQRTLDAPTARSPPAQDTPPDSPSPPTPVMIRELVLPKKANTPPPVSMRTRRPYVLRVPPPLRPRSTPAGPVAGALQRRTSRENIQSYPSYQQPAPGPTDEGSSAPPPIPPMHPRRSMELMRRPNQPELSHPPPRQMWMPNWDVRADHDAEPRMYAHVRSSSMTSASYVTGSMRPASAQAFPHGGPPLRHRASYDGFTHGPIPGNFMPLRGPGSDRHADYPYDPTAGQWDSYGPYPPHVLRGQVRGSGRGGPPGHQPPFRVLHSYNSPAYRNVPIWG